MGDEEKLKMKKLENRSYRQIQHMAKSMGLPSNYKKVYLIELIYAKKFLSEEDVLAIIQRVKQERLMTSKARKAPSRPFLQKTYKTNYTVSSNSVCNSPPITLTPKRPDPVYITYSPGQALQKYNPKRSILQSLHQQNTALTPKINSDRVLRSFNIKTIKSPVQFSYDLMSLNDNRNNNSLNSVNKKEARIKIIRNTQSYPNDIMTAKFVIKNHKPAILNSNPYIKRPLAMPATANEPSTIPSKRHRTVSGIYPLRPIELRDNIQKSRGFSLRKNDGSLTKINALVQKRNGNIITIPRNHTHTAEINVQDIINDITETNIANFSDARINNFQETRYPSMPTLDTEPNQQSINAQHEDSKINALNETSNNLTDFYSVYYHKKIRAEQMKYQKLREQETERLPKINDVFTQFNNIHKDFTQPLYVQVSSEAERSQSYPYLNSSNPNGVMLESLYNFKNHLLTNAPLLQIATTSNTKCVYSTPTITTAWLQQPASGTSDAYNYTSFEPDNRCTNDTDTHLNDFVQFCEEHALQRNIDYNCPTCFAEPCHALDNDVTIPEMVEDALEIISQDGDYMERIEMDVRVQCVVCFWAGPKIILEYHIRKEHAELIHSTVNSECNVNFSLGSLMRGRLWVSRLLEHEAGLYIISVKYHDSDCFMATLTSLTVEDINKVGSLTVYNKLSGEPFTWNHYIQPLPSDLPYENTVQGLKLNISRLDLLPNSANLQLVNRELVSSSPNNVFVGPPALDDINVTLFVKIFN